LTTAPAAEHLFEVFNLLLFAFIVQQYCTIFYPF